MPSATTDRASSYREGITPDDGGRVRLEAQANERISLERDAPAGWFATTYERAYQRMTRTLRDGEAAVDPSFLRSAASVPVPMGGGLEAIFTLYPRRRQQAPVGSKHDDPGSCSMFGTETTY